MFLRRLGVIVAAGFVLRVLYTVLVSPWPPAGIDDQTFYHLEPLVIAHGHGFLEPIFFKIGQIRPSAEHPPGLPVVLAALAKVGLTSPMAQRLTGTVFGSVTVLAAGLIGRRVAGERSGLAAAGLAAIYPILITADGALMSESLYGMLVALTVLAALRFGDGPTIRRGALLGAVAALAALTRGEAIVLLGLLLIPIVRRPGAWRACLVSLVAAIVVLAPWTIRNAVAFHRFVLVSNDFGAVIGGANCPGTYFGNYIGAWSFTCNNPPPGDEGQEAADEMHAGLRYAAHHLGRLPAVLVAREERVWGLRGAFETNPGRDRRLQDLGVLMYYLLLVPAAIGLYLLRRRRARSWAVVAPIVTVALVAAVGYGFLRLREPADISLVVLAGVALDAGLGQVRARRQARADGRLA